MMFLEKFNVENLCSRKGEFSEFSFSMRKKNEWKMGFKRERVWDTKSLKRENCGE